ncbi:MULTISPECIES: cytochrome c oxidase subunit I [unclassified Cupriavidus]|uniref:SCO family protein n=1 Tax=unclassified Cupriavidus TaxID=2640874 RepID=UPI0003FD8BCF|nr:MULTISPECIES: cytochrome c oxidase subunit I [unclassified Cupriavidus]MBP0627305.1 cytochrome C oxidase subunit I [Cupriavidus sp. AcVe19-1a]MBP0636621.1 cytochrome C oxidase subunit I [Cupriavidus sp. AcVe19-6a]
MAQQDPAPAIQATPQDPRIDARTRRGRLQMLMLLLVCASPVIASYFTYYVIKPRGGATNYGALVDPQRPMPPVRVTDEQGNAVPLEQYRGKWLLVTADPSACDEACAKKLFTIRQIRAGQGQDRERIVPVWLITDDGKVDERLRAAYNEPYAGVRFLRIDRQVAQQWLPAEAGKRAEDTIFLVDPLGNLMMRFPQDPDPKKLSGDLKKLLKVSRIG